MDRVNDEKKSADLLFCVSGSIAATVASSILQIIVERNIFSGTRVVISRSALNFIREEPLAILSGRSCVSNIFSDAQMGTPTHIDLANNSSIALIAPATANIIGKLANGIIDDAITSVLSVFEGPIVIVSAIHHTTARKLSLRRNCKILEEDGFHFCGPVHGFSVSERSRGLGIGAMPPPHVIVAYIEHLVRTGIPPDVSFEKLHPPM